MHLRQNSIRCGAVIALIMATVAPSAYAKTKNVDAQALLKALEKQSQRIEEGERALAVHQQKIATERVEFQALKAKVESLIGNKVKLGNKSAATRHLVSAVPSAQDGEIPSEVGTERKQGTPEKPPEVAKYIEEGGVLLPRGKLEISPSLEYDRLSATTVAIQGFSIIPALNIGLFDISQVNRDVLIGAVQARMGVTDRIEIEAKIPYVYGKQSTTGRQVGVGTSSNTVTAIGGQGMGDIEVGAHYQINNGQNGWPYFVGNLRYKSTTGTGPFEKPPNSFGLQTELATGSGFAAVQPSVTMIYPSDPVVFYSNLGYVMNFSQSYPGYGDIQPGSAISASFGMSLALNDEASVSLGYSHSMVFRTMINNNFIPGSYDLQVGSLDLGYSYTINEWMGINLSIGAGLTADAPDDRVVIRVPMTFNAF